MHLVTLAGNPVLAGDSTKRVKQILVGDRNNTFLFASRQGYQKKSETDAAGSKEADAGNRHWYKIETGVEITAGTEQAGTQREKPQEKRGRRAANV